MVGQLNSHRESTIGPTAHGMARPARASEAVLGTFYSCVQPVPELTVELYLDRDWYCILCIACIWNGTRLPNNAPAADSDNRRV